MCETYSDFSQPSQFPFSIEYFCFCLELLLYGGVVNGDTLADIWMYRVSQNDWTKKGSLLAASCEHVSMAVTGIQCP